MNNEQKLLRFAEIVHGTHLERLARYFLSGGNVTLAQRILINEVIAEADK